MLEIEKVENGKKKDGYWHEAKKNQQVVHNILPIVEALCPGYFFFFLFDNARSHFVYVKDVFQVQDMNKESGEKQPILQNGWFDIQAGCIT